MSPITRRHPEQGPPGQVDDPALGGTGLQHGGRTGSRSRQQVQQSLSLLFETFRRTGSALATVKAFRQQGLQFPRRPHTGPGQGGLGWGELGHSQTLRILSNPRYKGAFVFGGSQNGPKVEGGHTARWLPQEQWNTLIRDADAGHLCWEEHEPNQRRLHQGAQARGADRRRSPAREGPALLQSLLVCGRGGKRMNVRYLARGGRLEPSYLCQRQRVEHGEDLCQAVPGAGIDRAVGELLVEVVTPVALEVPLSV